MNDLLAQVEKLLDLPPGSPDSVTWLYRLNTAHLLKQKLVEDPIYIITNAFNPISEDKRHKAIINLCPVSERRIILSFRIHKMSLPCGISSADDDERMRIFQSYVDFVLSEVNQTDNTLIKNHQIIHFPSKNSPVYESAWSYECCVMLSLGRDCFESRPIPDGPPPPDVPELSEEVVYELAKLGVVM